MSEVKQVRRYQPTEIRVSQDADVASPSNGTLRGYAAKFGVESEVMYDCDGPFVEVIAPGAFKRTLIEQPDIRALYNHDTSHVLGRTKSKTLELIEDEVGLAFVVNLPDTQVARDVKESVKRGDIDGCSFGFCVVEDEVQYREGKPALRTLIDVELFEISPAVAFPAYLDTEVMVRSRKRPLTTPILDHASRALRLLDA